MSWSSIKNICSDAKTAIDSLIYEIRKEIAGNVSDLTPEEFTQLQTLSRQLEQYPLFLLQWLEKFNQILAKIEARRYETTDDAPTDRWRMRSANKIPTIPRKKR